MVFSSKRLYQVSVYLSFSSKSLEGERDTDRQTHGYDSTTHISRLKKLKNQANYFIINSMTLIHKNGVTVSAWMWTRKTLSMTIFSSQET
jgi:hypothetical protein